MKSKQNQARVYIDFKSLKDAKIPSKNMRFPTKEQMVKMSVDDTFATLNEFLRKGYILPRNLMNLVLKKFQNFRYGDENEAELLFEYICKKFPLPKDTNDPDVRDTYSEMMLVYVRRAKGNLTDDQTKKLIEMKLMPIFKTFMNSYTYNCILEAYASIEDYKTIIDLCNNEKYKLFTDDWTYKFYLKAVLNLHGRDKAYEEYKNVLSHFINGSGAHEVILKAYQNSYKNAKEIFDKIPEKMRKETTYRHMLKIYLDNKNFSEAIEFFKSKWPKKTEPSYQAIINRLYENDKGSTFLFYKEALERGFFKTLNIERNLKYSKDKTRASVWLDVHSEHIKAGGTPTRGSYLNNVIQITLDHLRLIIIKQNENTLFDIEIICGKGEKFKTRDTVEELLKKTFPLLSSKITRSPDGGCLYLYLNSKQIKYKVEDLKENLEVLNELYLQKMRLISKSPILYDKIIALTFLSYLTDDDKIESLQLSQCLEATRKGSATKM